MARRPAINKRNLLLTLAMVIWVPGCSVACWWQITVALAGDSLADLYSVEWPAFALFGIYAWWRLIHDEPGEFRLPTPAPEATAEATMPARRREDEDEDLAQYNDYLAALAQRGRKSWKRS